MDRVGAKFRTAVPETIFEKEKKVPSLVSNPVHKNAMKKDRIVSEMKALVHRDPFPGMPEFDELSNDTTTNFAMREALSVELNQLLNAEEDERIDRNFIDGFIAWIQGEILFDPKNPEDVKRAEDIKKKTWWWWAKGKNLKTRGKDGPYSEVPNGYVFSPVKLHGEDFVAYLRSMVGDKYEFLKKIEVLKNFVPPNLKTAWLYWKYIINGTGELLESDFLEVLDRLQPGGGPFETPQPSVVPPPEVDPSDPPSPIPPPTLPPSPPDSPINTPPTTPVGSRRLRDFVFNTAAPLSPTRFQRMTNTLNTYATNMGYYKALPPASIPEEPETNQVIVINAPSQALTLRKRHQVPKLDLSRVETRLEKSPPSTPLHEIEPPPGSPERQAAVTTMVNLLLDFDSGIPEIDLTRGQQLSIKKPKSKKVAKILEQKNDALETETKLIETAIKKIEKKLKKKRSKDLGEAIESSDVAVGEAYMKSGLEKLLSGERKKFIQSDLATVKGARANLEKLYDTLADFENERFRASLATYVYSQKFLPGMEALHKKMKSALLQSSSKWDEQEFEEGERLGTYFGELYGAKIRLGENIDQINKFSEWSNKRSNEMKNEIDAQLKNISNVGTVTKAVSRLHEQLQMPYGALKDLIDRQGEALFLKSQDELGIRYRPSAFASEAKEALDFARYTERLQTAEIKYHMAWVAILSEESFQALREHWERDDLLSPVKYTIEAGTSLASAIGDAVQAIGEARGAGVTVDAGLQKEVIEDALEIVKDLKEIEANTERALTLTLTSESYEKSLDKFVGNSKAVMNFASSVAGATGNKILLPLAENSLRLMLSSLGYGPALLGFIANYGIQKTAETYQGATQLYLEYQEKAVERAIIAQGEREKRMVNEELLKEKMKERSRRAMLNGGAEFWVVAGTSEQWVRVPLFPGWIFHGWEDYFSFTNGTKSELDERMKAGTIRQISLANLVRGWAFVAKMANKNHDDSVEPEFLASQDQQEYYRLLADNVLRGVNPFMEQVYKPKQLEPSVISKVASAIGYTAKESLQGGGEIAGQLASGTIGGFKKFAVITAGAVKEHGPGIAEGSGRLVGGILQMTGIAMTSIAETVFEGRPSFTPMMLPAAALNPNFSRPPPAPLEYASEQQQTEAVNLLLGVEAPQPLPRRNEVRGRVQVSSERTEEYDYVIGTMESHLQMAQQTSDLALKAQDEMFRIENTIDTLAATPGYLNSPGAMQRLHLLKFNGDQALTAFRENAKRAVNALLAVHNDMNRGLVTERELTDHQRQRYDLLKAQYEGYRRRNLDVVVETYKRFT